MTDFIAQDFYSEERVDQNQVNRADHYNDLTDEGRAASHSP